MGHLSARRQALVPSVDCTDLEIKDKGSLFWVYAPVLVIRKDYDYFRVENAITSVQIVPWLVYFLCGLNVFISTSKTKMVVVFLSYNRKKFATKKNL
jgi:hypothetical protein